MLTDPFTRWLFPTTEAPRFHRGTSIALGLTVVIFVFAIINSLYLAWTNKRQGKTVAEAAPVDLAEEARDPTPSFKYVT